MQLYQLEFIYPERSWQELYCSGYILISALYNGIKKYFPLLKIPRTAAEFSFLAVPSVNS